MNLKSMKRLAPFVLVLVLLATALPVTLLAQEGSCPALMERALQLLGDNCGDMDRNSACYGYYQVAATFTEEQGEDYFSLPADRTGVALLKSIATTAIDPTSDWWGIAIMSLQTTNIPNTIPGQAVTFMLLGDVELESAVAPEEAFSPADPLPVTVRQGSNIRSGPGLTYNVLGAASPGEVLQADGFSPDGDWLRIVYRDVPAWIFADLVTANDDLTGLPTLSPDMRMPMQAFYLRTGIGEVACEEAPQDTLMVQGPEGIKVDLTVNGASVSLGSTALFRTVEGDEDDEGDALEITVLDGEATVDGVIIPAGYKSRLCLSEPEDLGTDGEANDRMVNCEPSPPEPLGDDEQLDWCALGDVPASLLNYRIPINCDTGLERIPTPSPVPQNPPPGQSRPTPPPATEVPTGEQPPAGDCSTLAIGGPTGIIDPVTQTFWWNGVATATDYIVRIATSYNAEYTYPTGSPNPYIDIGGFLPDSWFFWAVDAYQNGQLLCTVVSPQVNVAPSPFGGSWACDYGMSSVIVNWYGAAVGDIITVEVFDQLGKAYRGSGQTPTGMVSIPVDWYDITSGVITTSSGLRYALPGQLGSCAG